MKSRLLQPQRLRPPAGWMVLLGLLPCGVLAAAHRPGAAHGAGGAWWMLPVWAVLAMAAHALLGRALKAILAASLPLSADTAEVAGYERTVYGCADRAMRQVAASAALTGLLFWLAARTAWPGAGLLASLALLGVLALDLSRWSRVAVSADMLWCQRGIGQKKHRLPIDDIEEAVIAEVTTSGWTLLHGRRSPVCRLTLRLRDQRTVALPKTDAHTESEAVEAVANHIRMRQQMTRGTPPAQRAPRRAAANPAADAPDTVPAGRMRDAAGRS